jgi:hypothetical protein
MDEYVSVSATIQMREKLQWIWLQLKTLNLFGSESDDPARRKRQIHATRLFIVLLTVSFATLTCVYIFKEEAQAYEVLQPTQEEHERLVAKFRGTLECPCQKKEPIKEFLALNVIYHPICSSDLTSSSFINQLSNINTTGLHPMDFLVIGKDYFQNVQLFCNIMKSVIFELQERVFREPPQSDQLLTSQQLQEQIKGTLDFEKKESCRILNRSIRATEEMMFMNHPISMAYDLYKLKISPIGNVTIEQRMLGNCSCLLDPIDCFVETGFYSYHSSNDTFSLSTIVQGFRLGCSPYNTLLHSSFVCWYSSDCYRQVIEYRVFQPQVESIPIFRQSKSGKANLSSSQSFHHY